MYLLLLIKPLNWIEFGAVIVGDIHNVLNVPLAHIGDIFSFVVIGNDSEQKKNRSKNENLIEEGKEKSSAVGIGKNFWRLFGAGDLRYFLSLFISFRWHIGIGNGIYQRLQFWCTKLNRGQCGLWQKEKRKWRKNKKRKIGWKKSK